MALDWFCYTSLDPQDAHMEFSKLKAKSSVNYESDFILSTPRILNETDEEIVQDYVDLNKVKSVFLVRLNNKTMLSKEILSELARDLKSTFPDLLILQENENLVV